MSYCELKYNFYFIEIIAARSINKLYGSLKNNLLNREFVKKKLFSLLKKLISTVQNVCERVCIYYCKFNTKF